MLMRRYEFNLDESKGTVGMTTGEWVASENRQTRVLVHASSSRMYSTCERVVQTSYNRC